MVSVEVARFRHLGRFLSDRRLTAGPVLVTERRMLALGRDKERQQPRAVGNGAMLGEWIPTRLSLPLSATVERQQASWRRATNLTPVAPPD